MLVAAQSTLAYSDSQIVLIATIDSKLPLLAISPNGMAFLAKARGVCSVPISLTALEVIVQQ